MKADQKHIHAEAIIAWANGATIEASANRDAWFEAAYPEWHKSQFYRVKPTPKPPRVHEVMITNSPSAGPLLFAVSQSQANCRLVFDGDTRELLSAQVV